MKYGLVITVFTLFLGHALVAQNQVFTRQDTLRGSITPERSWWNLLHYDLEVEVVPDRKYIQGKNTLSFQVLREHNTLQLELQAPMQIDRVLYEQKELPVKKEGIFHFIRFPEAPPVGSQQQIDVYFSGSPVVAKNPPWDGGFTWKKDANGKHFIANSNQGAGASLWWPCKDHPADEPDNGATIRVKAPANLMAVCNGRLVKSEDNGQTKTWHWQVVNPINDYGININLGDYVYFSEVYKGEKGDLPMHYYVLRQNEAKAREQFKQAPLMMKAFEHWFGPYPFYEDHFKLVEVPYLGMEHQSSVTYGNNYQNGYRGDDLSNSGWGLMFDFIIIHEAGHEWFANNITYNDVADMWVHEGFTAYSENLYLDYHYGKKASAEYVIGTRERIRNNTPVIGPYGVNQEGSGDMYYKGSNTLHTLRQWIGNDEKWRHILRGLNREFYHQTVSSKQVEDYISRESGLDLTAFFDQYLRTTKIPVLEYKLKGKSLQFRYTNTVPGFNMPLLLDIDGVLSPVSPTQEWKTTEAMQSIHKVAVKQDYYVECKRVDG